MQKLTMEQAVVISGYTGVLACPFDVLHGEIEKRMGRPVWTHELGSHELMETEIKPKFKADFLAMLPANIPMTVNVTSPGSSRPALLSGAAALDSFADAECERLMRDGFDSPWQEQAALDYERGLRAEQ